MHSIGMAAFRCAVSMGELTVQAQVKHTYLLPIATLMQSHGSTEYFIFLRYVNVVATTVSA